MGPHEITNASVQQNKKLIEYRVNGGMTTHEELRKLNKKQSWELNREFSKEINITNKYFLKCSTSFHIRKTQIKTTLRAQLIPVRGTI